MDIRPCIIGPDLTINPDLVIQPFDKKEFPMPGLLVSTRDVVLLFGENKDAAISIKHCSNLQLQGAVGKNQADLTCRFEDGQYQIKGLYGEIFSQYSIIPINDGSLRISGEVGHQSFNIRVFSTPSLCTMDGIIFGNQVEYKLDQLTPDSYAVKGKEGESGLDIRIFYTDEGIRIKGNHGGLFVEYSVISTGDQIEMKGMTKDRFSNQIFTMISENELQVTGKPYQLPVDYKLTLYDNGVGFSGNTGFHKSDFGFVTEQE